jgi:putative transposase
MGRNTKSYKKKMPIKDQEILAVILCVLKGSRKGRNKIIRMVKKVRPDFSASRIRRVYENNGLSLAQKPTKRRIREDAKPLDVPLTPMEEWAMDFMHDRLENGRNVRTLNMIDHCNRKCIGVFIDASLPASKVIECLSRMFEYYGKPNRIRTDNGPEFRSKLLRRWLLLKEVNHVFIQPGKPAQNAIIERFNRTYREDVLDANLFHSLDEMRAITAEWVKDYNEERPHQSLNYQTPNVFAA